MAFAYVKKFANRFLFFSKSENL